MAMIVMFSSKKKKMSILYFKSLINLVKKKKIELNYEMCAVNHPLTQSITINEKLNSIQRMRCAVYKESCSY